MDTHPQLLQGVAVLLLTVTCETTQAVTKEPPPREDLVGRLGQKRCDPLDSLGEIGVRQCVGQT